MQVFYLDQLLASIVIIHTNLELAGQVFMYEHLDPSTRPLIATAPSGEQYIVRKMQVYEAINQPVHISLTLLAKKFSAEGMLGKELGITYSPGVSSNRKLIRSFHGLVTHVSIVDVDSVTGLPCYDIELKSWLWLLTLRHNCRIFQNCTTLDIAQTLFKEHGFAKAYKFEVRPQLNPINYCVQYNESDYEFLMRLMADAGLNYHFLQTKASHTLIIGSSNQSFKQCPENKLEYWPTSKNRKDAIISWQPSYSIHRRSWSVGGYNRDQALSIHGNNIKSRINYGTQTFPDSFQWQPGIVSTDLADDAAQSQIDSDDMTYGQVFVNSCLSSLYAGGQFDLSLHPDVAQQGSYILTKVQHFFSVSEQYKSTEYHNNFTCQLEKYPIRLPAIPKKCIKGFHSATVSGPKNSEINTDKLGRVKVYFHWDYSGKNDESSSCWLPVLQPLAGDSFGISFLPRVGQEVLVAFIDGDPDQPVVAGSLYNGKNTPPYKEADILAIKSKTTPSGNETGTSEFKISDKKGEELLGLTACKEMRVDVGEDRTSTIKGQDNTSIEKDYNLSVKQNITTSADENYSVSAKKGMTIHCDQDTLVNSTDNLSQKAKTIILKATSSIELSVSGNILKISPSGISLDAKTISIDAKEQLALTGLSAKIDARSSVKIKGLEANINGNLSVSLSGGAMVKIQGGLVRIN